MKYWEVNFTYSIQMSDLIINVLRNLFKFTYIWYQIFYFECNQLLKIMNIVTTKPYV